MISFWGSTKAEARKSYRTLNTVLAIVKEPVEPDLFTLEEVFRPKEMTSSAATDRAGG